MLMNTGAAGTTAQWIQVPAYGCRHDQEDSDEEIRTDTSKAHQDRWLSGIGEHVSHAVHPPRLGRD